MREGWRTVPLGEVAAVNPKCARVTEESPFITMSDVAEWGRWAASTSAKGTRGGTRAEGGDVLVARITPCLENGKIAMVPRDLGAVGGSTEFIVLRGSESVLSEYLYLWASERSNHSAAVRLMVGSTGRQRVSAQDLGALQINLPPLDEQQRIVDLIESLDHTIEAADTAAEASNTSTKELRRDLLAPRDGVGSVALRDVASWGSGKYVAKENRVVDGLYPIFGANGEIGRTDSFLYDEDLITVGRVGACGEVHRVSGKSWVSDNALVARPDPGNFEYVYQAVQGVDYIALISGTSQPLITQTALLGVKVPWPPADERERIAAVLADATYSAAAAQAYAGALRATRSELLTVLLSGEHEIPESYDIDTAVQLEPAA